MAFQEFSAAADNSTDANFRLWGKGISDALTAIGIPKSADTGQIDWTTVTRPLATSTYQGYEIRYLNDSKHATAPVYIKIEYGSDNTTTAIPNLAMTTGSGSNGSGTITSILHVRVVCQMSIATTFHVWSIAGNASGFFITNDTALTTRPLILVERWRDSDGTINARGHHSMSVEANEAGSGVVRFNPHGGTSTTESTGPATFLPYPMANLGDTTNIAGGPVVGSVFGWLSVGVQHTLLTMSCPYGAFTPGALVPVTRFGVSRTYKHLPRYYFGPRLNSSTNDDVYSSCLVLWEA